MLIAIQQVWAQIKNPRNLPFDWSTDTTNHVIDLSEITIVVPRGTFPNIDYPPFLGKKKGLEAFFEHEPVIAVEINGHAKAYPLNMLTSHEMSNDTLAGVPILPTYCPLCNASITYDRRFDNRILEFEVSGMLRNSDMVMLDRVTQTLWQQLTGEGIVGEYAGKHLAVVPSLVLTVKEFFQRYEHGQILSPNNGTRAAARYGINPYEGYDNIDASPYDRFFKSENIDRRLPPMERVVDIRVGEDYKVYPFSILASQEVINDSFKGKNVVLFHQGDAVSVLDKSRISESRKIGTATVFNAKLDDRSLTFSRKKGQFIDEQTESRWDITGHCISGELKGKQLIIEPHSNHFAFAWLAFRPNSEIYEK